MSTGYMIRSMQHTDLPVVEAVVRATKVFFPKELKGAMRLLRSSLAPPEDRALQTNILEEAQSGVVGLVCYGDEDLAEAYWKIHWLIVDPKAQGRGYGRVLMDHAERAIAAKGGEWIVVETGSSNAFESTRAFYHGLGYQQVGRLPQFFAKDDDKVILLKALPRQRSAS